MEQLTEERLISGMEEFLSNFFENSFPQPVRARVTGWGRDPRTRGSYSYLSNRSEEFFTQIYIFIPSSSSLPGSPACLAEPVGGLLFAGEATHSSYFGEIGKLKFRSCETGTVHGALDSGRREAERILSWKVEQI